MHKAIKPNRFALSWWPFCSLTAEDKDGAAGDDVPPNEGVSCCGEGANKGKEDGDNVLLVGKTVGRSFFTGKADGLLYEGTGDG